MMQKEERKATRQHTKQWLSPEPLLQHLLVASPLQLHYAAFPLPGEIKQAVVENKVKLESWRDNALENNDERLSTFSCHNKSRRRDEKVGVS